VLYAVPCTLAGPCADNSSFKRFDTSGNILEHYSDGDVVNKDTPYTRSPEAPDSLYIWGPNLPLGFVTGNPDDANKEAGPPPPAPVAA
jgi:hypothetical protein